MPYHEMICLKYSKQQVKLQQTFLSCSSNFYKIVQRIQIDINLICDQCYLFLLSTIYDLTSLRHENTIKHLLFNMENNPLKQKKCIDNDIKEINNFMSAIKSISIKNL